MASRNSYSYKTPLSSSSISFFSNSIILFPRYAGVFEPYLLGDICGIRDGKNYSCRTYVAFLHLKRLY